jgi:hypothetical protein
MFRIVSYKLLDFLVQDKGALVNEHDENSSLKDNTKEKKSETGE